MAGIDGCVHLRELARVGADEEGVLGVERERDVVQIVVVPPDVNQRDGGH